MTENDQSICTHRRGRCDQRTGDAVHRRDNDNDRSDAGVFANATPTSVRFIWSHQVYSVLVAVITALYDISRADLPAVVRDTHPEATGGAVVERRYLTNPHAQEIIAEQESAARKAWYDARQRELRPIYQQNAANALAAKLRKRRSTV